MCTPDDCSALIDAFPLAIAGQNAPSETGSYYYFGYLVFHEVRCALARRARMRLKEAMRGAGRQCRR